MNSRKPIWSVILFCAFFFSYPTETFAQTPSQEDPPRPQYKGIWEPVNYPADLVLTDVFCVNVDVCWVSGAAGTILKTTDGGQSWTPQLGGDPQAGEPPVEGLRFMDERRGWALQRSGIVGPFRLLRTTDGETWEPVGTIPHRLGVVDYVFLSETVGVYLDGNKNASAIFRTTDGGRNWQEVLSYSACRGRLEIEGLTREVECALRALHFPSREVGYAVGGSRSDWNTLFVAKTEDAGASWRLSWVRDLQDVWVGGAFDVVHSLFFTDESSGLLFLNGKRLYATTDGGQSWTGLMGSAGPRISFPDREVGWAFERFGYGRTYKLNYTTNSGRSWTSRTFQFPAQINAFSFPRRDRAYVVGNHGMIYRYRIVPVEYTAANALDAPAMPALPSGLER